MTVLSDPRAIKTHFEQLWSERSTWERLWQEMADWGLARRRFTSPEKPQGEGKRTHFVYNNTMQVSNDLLASGIHNLVTSTAVRWAKIVTDPPELMNDPDVALWVEVAEDRFFEHINRHEAGFHPQMAEVYNDLAAFGNGAISILRDPGKGLFYQAMPLSETYIDEGSGGRIQNVFRLFRYTPQQLIGRYGQESPNPALNDIWNRANKDIEMGSVSNRIELIQALIPNPSFREGARIGPRTNRIHAITMERNKAAVIEERFFREMPIAFGRWNRDPGELYARGPGVQAFSDAKMLSEMSRLTLEAAQKAVDPPLLVPDTGFITQLDMSPAGLSVYRAGTKDPVSPLYANGTVNPELGVEMERHVESRVKAAYHFELLQLLQDPRMSATQVLELSARAQQILSPLVGRIQSEMIDPLVRRSMAILMRAGWIPTPPEALRGQAIDFQYISPVQRAQRANEANAVLAAVNASIQLGQIDPGALDTMDPDAIVRFFFDAYGTPDSLTRSPEQVAQIQAQRAQQVARQEQQEEQAQQMQNLAPMLQVLQGGQAS